MAKRIARFGVHVLGSNLNIRHFAGFLQLPLRLLATHQPLPTAAGSPIRAGVNRQNAFVLNVLIELFLGRKTLLYRPHSIPSVRSRDSASLPGEAIRSVTHQVLESVNAALSSNPPSPMLARVLFVAVNDVEAFLAEVVVNIFWAYACMVVVVHSPLGT